MLSVHILREPEPQDLALLRAELRPDVLLTTGQTLPDPADFHMLIAGRPDPDLLTASPNLRHLVIPWAGLPRAVSALLPDYPRINVHNLHHNAQPTAELALALLLAAAKQIMPFDRALRAGDWRPRYVEPPAAIGLAGKTALILGLGHIGRVVARGCRALGMNVIGVRRQAGKSADGTPVHGLAELADLLPQAQALIVCLPLTAATRGLIDAAALAALPARAVLVNIGRGEIIEEAALYMALQTGRLAGAGIDVWYNYPPDEAARAHTLPSNFPLHELDNVVLSPHRGGSVDDTERRRMAALAALINATAAGDGVPNEVSLHEGY